MPVEWEDDEIDSWARVPGIGRLNVNWSYGYEQFWASIPTKLMFARFPTREAAKSAAETEARRVLMQGLRALGWPDEAAVERAWDTLYDRGVEYTGDLPSIARAALTAAVEG